MSETVTAIAYMDAQRVHFLDRLSANLRGAPVPGRDLAAWVAPLPTAALVEILLHPAERMREILFAARGAARLASRPVLDQDLSSGLLDRVPLHNTAQASFMVWVICRVAREYLDAGLAAEAQRALIAVTRSIHLWPTPIARRFEPQVEAV